MVKLVYVVLQDMLRYKNICFFMLGRTRVLLRSFCFSGTHDTTPMLLSLCAL